MSQAWLKAVVACGLAGCGASSSEAAPCAHRVKIEVKQVEDGSDLMEKIARRVGLELHDSPGLGISPQLDAWRSDELARDGLPSGERRHRDWYLEATDRAALERYLASDGLAKSKLVAPADHQLVFEPLPADADRPARWRSYYVVREPVIDDRVITAAVADGEYVNTELTADGARRWAAATKASGGRKLAIMVDGVVVSAPVVQVEVTRFRIRLPAAQVGEVAGKLACGT